MLCKIADLLVQVPDAGGMSPRCWDYLWKDTQDEKKVDFFLREDLYRTDMWPGLPPDLVPYMESGAQFYCALLHFNGMMIHASAVALDGKAYLFSGPCGIGKSTHTNLWQHIFGTEVQRFNDDKPAVRRIDGQWFAYGTPWCGKESINLNQKWPLAGICFLKHGKKNRIRRLTVEEAISKLLWQTTYHLKEDNMNLLLQNIGFLVQEIPIFELENRPEEEAVRLSYETMCRAAEEAGL